MMQRIKYYINKMGAQGELVTLKDRFDVGGTAERAAVISEAHEVARLAFEDMMIIYDTSSIPEKLGIYTQAQKDVVEFRQQLLGSGELSDELVRAYADANFLPGYLEIYGPECARDALQKDLADARAVLLEVNALDKILNGDPELIDMSVGDKQKLLATASQSFRYRTEDANFHLNELEQKNSIPRGQNRDIGQDAWGAYRNQFLERDRPGVEKDAQAIQSCSSIIYELRHRLGL